eukprot:4595627-Karenia_brevis.AAC.1
MAACILQWCDEHGFFPEGVKGGLRQRDPSDCYLDLALDIEATFVDGGNATGATADIIKYFDNLPRAPMQQ